MRIQKTLAALCSLFVAQSLTLAAFAVEVTEPAGAAHGYPGLYDINGKKLADSELAAMGRERSATCGYHS